MKAKLYAALTLSIPVVLSLSSFAEAAQISLYAASGLVSHKITHFVATRLKGG